MKKVAIVGFGRFGKTLFRLLKNDFEIGVYDILGVDNSSGKYDVIKSIEDIYCNYVIFYCVPISEFENVMAEHSQFFNKENLLIDVLSVKLYPQKILKKYLGTSGAEAILTHPLFGPDSSKDGFEGLPIVVDKFLSSEHKYSFWCKYFSSKGLNVIKMSADEHDRKMAYSQGITHLLGRVLDEMDITPTTVDTVGAKKLLEIREQTCNDTWQLFLDLQLFNSYTKQMRLDMNNAFDNILNKLLKDSISDSILTVGIQGGVGSFNEEAVRYYLEENNIKDFKIKYLYTSEAVLNSLIRGDIDRGQFAIHNSAGGIVDESIEAMANYKFEIVEEFEIKISHVLMISPDMDFKDIDTIMTHPQVLRQCKHNLKEKYPNLKLTSGEGELIDHSKVAKELSKGNFPSNIATMGSKVLADIYGLKIIEENLQDLENNFTSFLFVKRK